MTEYIPTILVFFTKPTLTFQVDSMVSLSSYEETLLRTMWANFFILKGMSEGVEMRRECEATGKAEVSLARILSFYLSSKP